MYNLLKTITSNNEWVFMYARKDFANLFNEIEEVNKVHIFLDPVQISSAFDEYGSETSKTYSGSFMILLSSDIDEEDYDFRYQEYIKPIATGAVETIKTSIKCDGGYTIVNWQQVEVINAFDYNFDGVIITYNINE